MNVVLWTLQSLLASVFLVAGTTRAVSYDFARSRMAWVAAVPRPLLLFISAAEVLGALGLILPGLTRVDAFLTPVAAVMLGVVMVLAISFHSRRHEPRNAGANGALIALLAFVAVGRLLVAPL